MDTLTFLSQYWVIFFIGFAIASFCAGFNQAVNIKKMSKNFWKKDIEDVNPPFGGIALTFCFSFISFILMILAVVGFVGAMIQHFSA